MNPGVVVLLFAGANTGRLHFASTFADRSMLVYPWGQVGIAWANRVYVGDSFSLLYCQAVGVK